MDIRISVLRTDAGNLLKVDGMLTAARLPILESTLATLEMPFTVDLSELVAADEEGIRALRSLREAGAELVGLSPLMALRIGTHGESQGSHGATPPKRARKNEMRDTTRRRS